MTDADPAATTDLSLAIRAAYDASGASWDSGPRRIYDRLAAGLLDAASIQFTALDAVDVGAGTGAATAELLRRGARVVAVDLSTGMLSRIKTASARPLADTASANVAQADIASAKIAQAQVVAGDIIALPLRDAVADVAVAAYVLNHLPNPVDGLRELARITRAGGWVLTSSSGSTNDHPSKSVIDDLAAQYGFRAPAWYEQLKAGIHQQVSEPQQLVEFANGAGLRDARADIVQVSVATSPADLVSWRTGMAHLGPFVRSLSPTDADEFARRAHLGVRDMPPLELAMVTLVCRRG
ncbi:MAG TPA: class I SAM-dependent methyltransferase [Acidothermaceae bacterium]